MNEPQDPAPRPPRDPAVITRAIEQASVAAARLMVSSIADRGGTPEDLAELLARVNVVVIQTITEGQPDAKLKTEALVALISENSLKICRQLRSQTLLSKHLTKGPRP